MAPTPYTVERSAVIAAPADQTFSLLVDFHEWPRWSPWEDLDPDMQRTYGGAESGVGATYAWSGNRKAGAGTMEITDLVTPTALGIRLSFRKPFKAENRIAVERRPEGDGTRVTWRLTGDATGVTKVFARFGMFERWVGKDFDVGLARLRAEVSVAGLWWSLRWAGPDTTGPWYPVTSRGLHP